MWHVLRCCGPSRIRRRFRNQAQEESTRSLSGSSLAEWSRVIGPLVSLLQRKNSEYEGSLLRHGEGVRGITCTIELQIGKAHVCTPVDVDKGFRRVLLPSPDPHTSTHPHNLDALPDVVFVLIECMRVAHITCRDMVAWRQLDLVTCESHIPQSTSVQVYMNKVTMGRLFLSS